MTESRECPNCGAPENHGFEFLEYSSRFPKGGFHIWLGKYKIGSLSGIKAVQEITSFYNYFPAFIDHMEKLIEARNAGTDVQMRIAKCEELLERYMNSLPYEKEQPNER